MTLIALDDYQVLTVSGIDAKSFLQAQLANDVNALTIEQTQWTSCLTAQGRVIAVFALQFLNAECFRLFIPARRGEEIQNHLKRFVFRSKVQISLDHETNICGELPFPNDANAIPVKEIDGDFIKLPNESERKFVLPITPTQSQLLPKHEWLVANFKLGIPELSAEVSEKFTAHALGLDHLPAFSLKKGCYPGQEIVSRTHYLGKSRRSLLHLTLESSSEQFHIPTNLFAVDNTSQPVADVVQWSASGGRAHLLAIVKGELPNQGITDCGSSQIWRLA